MPLVVHLAGSITAHRMFKHKALITELSSCELMASACELIVDKNGKIINKIYFSILLLFIQKCILFYK